MTVRSRNLLIISSIFHCFQKNEIDFLYYLAENLAYLPYVTQEEPLFVMHHCDMVVSVAGAGYLQNFKEVRYLF